MVRFYILLQLCFLSKESLKLDECCFLTKQFMQSSLDCMQSLSFLLVIKRLERARYTTAHETGVSKVDAFLPILHAAVPLARSSLSITVDEKRRDCLQSKSSLTWEFGFLLFCPFLVPFFLIWSVINSVAWAHQSTQALPYTTIILLMMIWLIGECCAGQFWYSYVVES